MKSTILLILFFALNFNSFGQNIDSLLSEIDKTTDNSELALLYGEIGMYYDTLDRQKSIFYRKKSAFYYEKVGNLNEVVIKIGNVAQHFAHIGQIDSSIYYYEIAIDMLPKLNSMSTEPMLFINLADILSNSGEFERAASLVDKCLQTIETHPNDSIQIVALTRKGREFRRMNELEKSRVLYDSALFLSRKHNYPELTANLYNNISIIHYVQKEYRKSLKYLDSCEQFHEVYDLQNKFTQNYNRGKNLYFLKEYSTAKKYLYQCEKLLSEDTLEQSWKNLYYQVTYESLSQICEKQNNLEEAIFYLKKKNDVTEELRRVEKQKEILRLSEQFESEKKKQQIESLEKINLEKDKLHEAETRRNWLIAGFIMTLLILSIVFMLINNRNRKKVNESEREILQKNALLDGQKMERKRLSQDLHDGLGSTLASIKLNLESNPAVQKELISEVQKACDETRIISHALAGKSNRSFLVEIEEIFEPFNNDFQIIIDAFPKRELNETPELIQSDIKFILKECMNNALKHSNAEKIEVHLFIEDNKLMLLFEDNGVGMNTEKSEGIGISNIQNRVKKHQGDIILESKTNLGTSYHISIPLK